MDVTDVQHESLVDGVVDASFAQYAVTPTSSVADKANVTDVLVVDDEPLFIETDELYGAVVSLTVSKLLRQYLKLLLTFS